MEVNPWPVTNRVSQPETLELDSPKLLELKENLRNSSQNHSNPLPTPPFVYLLIPLDFHPQYPFLHRQRTKDTAARLIVVQVEQWITVINTMSIQADPLFPSFSLPLSLLFLLVISWWLAYSVL